MKTPKTGSDMQKEIANLKKEACDLSKTNAQLANRIAALKESEKRFGLAIEAGRVGIWDWDLTANTIHVNPTLKGLLGYAPHEIKDRIEDWRRYIHPEDLPKMYKKIQKRLNGNSLSGEVEHRMLYKGGGARWFLTHGKVVREKSGKPQRIMGTCIDITEYKTTEFQLRETQKKDAITTLAGGIAHQFNNALSPIFAYLDILALDLQSEDALQYVASMKESARRMSELTHQLLAYAHGGKYQAKIVSLPIFIRNTLPLVQQSIQKPVVIETDLPQDIPDVSLDLTQMRMVLSAVIMNAVEAVETGGRIRISCHEEALTSENMHKVPGLRAGLYVCLSIADTGKGMDQETRQRIFDPFFSTKFQGRGLSMAAAYGIIHNHGGAITVESEQGHGTTLYIYLPAFARKEVPVPKKKTRIEKGKGTILVIEDEAIVMRANRQALEMLGYNVLEARNGKEALDLVNTYAGIIDMALLDIGLPDMSGEALYPLIRQARPEMKVMVCSGYSIDGPVKAILDAGAEGFLPKPFSVKLLSQKLKTILSLG